MTAFQSPNVFELQKFKNTLIHRFEISVQKQYGSLDKNRRWFTKTDNSPRIILHVQPASASLLPLKGLQKNKKERTAHSLFRSDLVGHMELTSMKYIVFYWMTFFNWFTCRGSLLLFNTKRAKCGKHWKENHLSYSSI